jgi:hypothetical protein
MPGIVFQFLQQTGTQVLETALAALISTTTLSTRKAVPAAIA